jgi:hypothetical protein
MNDKFHLTRRRRNLSKEKSPKKKKDSDSDSENDAEEEPDGPDDLTPEEQKEKDLEECMEEKK